MTLFPRLLFACSILAASANASPLGIANAFNVFVFNNFTETGADTGGRLAAGGNVFFTGTYAIEQGPLDSYTVPNNDALVVDGLVSAGTANMVHGNAYVGATGAGSVAFPGGGSLTTGGASPVGVAGQAGYLTAYSAQLSQLSANGTTVDNGFGTITLTGSNANQNVFTMTLAQLGGNNSVRINIPAGSIAIVNVTGASGTTSNSGVYINGAGPNGDSSTGATSILFNFYQATSISFGSGFQGTALAPKADITGLGGQFDGGLIAKSFTGNTEFHDLVFNGALPAALPEPPSSALIGVGMVALAWVGRRLRLKGR